MLPMSQLIENCDQWHLCELADRWDGSIVSVTVLRRDFVRIPILVLLASRSLMGYFQGETNHDLAGDLR